MECTHESIINVKHNAAWFCEYLTDNCGENQTQINFFDIYWCDLDGNHVASVILTVLGLFLVIKMISITVEEYVSIGFDQFFA